MNGDYRPTLDGLRGFACLIVLIAHAGEILNLNYAHDASFGAIGVVLFFSLSGFLMSHLYIKENFNLKNIWHYAIARFSRIAPAYYIAVLLCWLIYLLLPDFKYQMDPVMMARSIFFAGNQGVFWSLPPEIQFYGFFLLLWFAFQKFKEGKYIWPLVTAFISIAFIATRDLWGGLMLPSKFHIFFFGFLAAFFIQHIKAETILKNGFFQIGIAITTVLYATTFKDGGQPPVYNDIVFAALVAITVASISFSTAITRVFEMSMMRIIGAVSFSVYLFHYPILHLLKELGIFAELSMYIQLLLYAAFTLVPPVMFYYLAERPLHQKVRNKLNQEFDKRITD